jgi:hypothetical protein
MKFILTCLMLVTSISAFSKTKIFFDQDILDKSSVETKSQRFEFIKKFIESKKLNLDKNSFILDEKSESLLATHYTYKQVLNGLTIKNATLSISIDNKSKRVVKVYNTASSDTLAMSSKRSMIPFMSSEQAVQIAWNSLKVDGELLAIPTAELLVKNTPTLPMVYIVSLSSSSPFGHWVVEVDARTGKVLSQVDQALSRKKHSYSIKDRLAKKRVTKSLSDAILAFNAKNISIKKKTSFVSVADGEAKVFDPNPVTTLVRGDFQDSTSSVEFADAYFIDTLKDLTIIDGLYHLKGPHIILADFENPSIPPSTTTDGKWMYERKDIKFNDAMTYYHLDKNIRYIESLGYGGSKSFFKKAMKVDANGLNGADNSHYIPSQRKLAFGHGCVDDNEDSDVILHELGHAINAHINKNWRGGDTGAMGEGFGDYWAASYSTSRKGGMDFHPEWVFKWDGHNDCWGGRKLDSTSIRYNHNRSYGAHRSVNGGVTDELWSTPIFQAFMELRARGVERSDLDKIILESQFGLGSGLKMRDLALSIVKTAEALYPAEDYASVYKKHFKNQKILK